MKDINLLFITRKYPPMVGGMENLSYAIAKEFNKTVNTKIISWGKSQKYLPLVLLLFLIKSLYTIPNKKINHIHIGDALLSPLGVILKTFFGVKTTITVVGLDVTFNFPGYQFMIPRCLKLMDKIICISDATKEECLKRGISPDKCVVIPCGVYPQEWIVKATRNDLEKILEHKLENKKVIITVGRLVKRKGVYWFIENVFPKLAKNTIYLVIGNGPEKEKITKLIQKLHLEKQVLLLGKLPDDKLRIVYNTADLFVMPNIKVPETMEGFGIVAVEASSTGLPVIASDIEGIRAAISDNKNGYLIKSYDAADWVDSINKVLFNSSISKKQIIEWTNKNYNWTTIGEMYLKSFK